MSDYIILRQNTAERYFFRSNRGLCVSRRMPSGNWSEDSVLLPDCRGGFGVYSDGERTHIICTDTENRLVYAVRRGGAPKKYVLSALGGNTSLSDMRLYTVSGRLNMLCIAHRGEKNLLVHCILGDNAQPSAIAALDAPYFCIYSDNVYYTDENGILGRTPLADEKPTGFTRLAESAYFPDLCADGEDELMLYVRDFRLFLNSSEILCDSRIEEPFFIRDGGGLYIMWKSGGTVRRIPIRGGAACGTPSRYVHTGAEISSCLVQYGGEMRRYCGSFSDNRLTLFGAPDIFTPFECPRQKYKKNL